MPGRHRATPARPASSRTARVAVRTGVAAIALVAPLTAVGTASAAEAAPAAAQDSTWDRIAACESSGDWSTDTGNGYRGGLQFTDSTWSSFGGGQFADKADEATRSEQISVARKVQSEQGWKAWPVCSKKAGVA